MAAQGRLGYMVPQFPGQTHAFFWREVKELEARGVPVRLLSTRPPPPGLVAHAWSEEAAARTLYLGRPAVADALLALPALPWGELRAPEKGFLRDLAIALPAARRLGAVARAEGLDHVHVHSCGRSALIAALSRRMGGPSYSLTLHGPLSDYGPGQNLKWRGAEAATVITERLLAEVRTVLRDDLPPRLVVQPMGVDTGRFRRDGPYLPRATGPFRVVSCGRLNVVKGHQDLLLAVRLLREGGLDASLTIIGEDDAGGTGFRATLEAKVAELGLNAHATLLGAVDEGRVREELLKAHAFALASWSEPLGVALMEAMACGVPTVGTAAGGVRELIRDGADGLLVPPRDPARLAAALRRIAEDAGLARALSAGGRARVETAFHAGRGAEALVALLGLRAHPG